MSWRNALRPFAIGLLVAVPCCTMTKSQAPLPAGGEGAQVNAVPPGGGGPDVRIPLNPPRVTCSNGQLTIRANSSTMRSVLESVKQCLGIALAIPASLDTQPVFLELGPGPADHVLNELLSMTDLDFVVLSAQTSASTILKVELSTRTTGEEKTTEVSAQTSGQMSPARLAWLAARNTGRGLPPSEDKAQAAEATTEAEPVKTEAETAAEETTPVTVPSASKANSTVAAADGLPATPAQPEASSQSDADRVLQNQITEMQKLFEQRKKLNGSGSDPKPNTGAPSAPTDADGKPLQPAP